MDDETAEQAIVTALRANGAKFGFLFGSRAAGSARTDSDYDAAGWFGRTDVEPWNVVVAERGRYDILVLDTAPLELAGRVATQGRLLFDDDPPARVEWQATTRKLYFDEQPRTEQARRDFADARGRR